MTLQLCMFCGEEISPDQLTMEHFVPKSLWEKGHRPDKMKTLPAHKECNQAFLTDNEYFRDVMLLEDGVERHPEAERVRSGALRRKFTERWGSIAKTLKNVGSRRVYTPSGIELGVHPVFEIDWPRIERVLCNVVKGIFYVTQGRPLPREFTQAVADVSFRPSDAITEVVNLMVPWQSFGDSVFSSRYVVSTRKPFEKMSCLLRFYEHRIFYGEAVSPAYAGGDNEVFVPASGGSQILVPRWTANG